MGPSPHAERGPGEGPVTDINAHLEAEQPQDTGALCEVLDLVSRLTDRVVELEMRLAAAGVPHTPSALDRQRARSRARLAGSSYLARFVADRERAV
jgi:hypothetical protein